MMHDEFTGLNGAKIMFDLDQVVDVVKGQSGCRSDWTALVVYNAPTRSLIELRSSPPDFRGNSADEAEEVTEQYVRGNFQMTADQLSKLRAAPHEWQLINRRDEID